MEQEVKKDLTKIRKRRQESNRLTLTNESQQKVRLWIECVNSHFNGMVSVKRNDLVNMVLEGLDGNLNSDLLESIRGKKLTDTQKAKWVYEQLKKAEETGDELDFDELLHKARGSKPRKRPAKIKKEGPKMKENAPSQTPKKTSNFNGLT